MTLRHTEAGEAEDGQAEAQAQATLEDREGPATQEVQAAQEALAIPEDREDPAGLVRQEETLIRGALHQARHQRSPTTQKTKPGKERGASAITGGRMKICCTKTRSH